MASGNSKMAAKMAMSAAKIKYHRRGENTVASAGENGSARRKAKTAASAKASGSWREAARRKLALASCGVAAKAAWHEIMAAAAENQPASKKTKENGGENQRKISAASIMWRK
jgi:hypothetical protein